MRVMERCGARRDGGNLNGVTDVSNVRGRPVHVLIGACRVGGDVHVPHPHEEQQHTGPERGSECQLEESPGRVRPPSAAVLLLVALVSVRVLVFAPVLI